jgi:hypothetical protein
MSEQIKTLPSDELAQKLHGLVDQFKAGKDGKSFLNEFVDAIPVEFSREFWLQYPNTARIVPAGMLYEPGSFHPPLTGTTVTPSATPTHQPPWPNPEDMTDNRDLFGRDR